MFLQRYPSLFRLLRENGVDLIRDCRVRGLKDRQEKKWEKTDSREIFLRTHAALLEQLEGIGGVRFEIEKSGRMYLGFAVRGVLLFRQQVCVAALDTGTDMDRTNRDMR